MQRTPIVVASACFSVFFAATGLADEVPVLNVAPLCRGIAAQGADPGELGDPSASFQGCMADEQNDRATLAKEWRTFSAQSRKDCADEAQTGGELSYTDLLTCLEMARDVERQGFQAQ